MRAFWRRHDGALAVTVASLSLLPIVLIVVLAVVANVLPPPPRLAGHVLLFCAGVVQGAFGTGGPLTIFVIGKEPLDKQAFRATMCALWLGLNVVLIGGFVVDERINASSLHNTAWLAIGLAIGLGVGELVHRTLPQGRFRVVVWIMLAVAGAALALR